MPYGIPWTSVVSYKCVKCHKVHDSLQYRPYCCLCGAEQPDETRAQEMGLAVSGSTLGKKGTRDIDEMAAFITKNHGKPIKLWDYCVSHKELELRLRHSEEPWLNTVIYCAGTEHIRLPTSAWNCSMTVKRTEGEDGPLFVLSDLAADVHVECRGLTLYFDVERGF